MSDIKLLMEKNEPIMQDASDENATILDHIDWDEQQPQSSQEDQWLTQEYRGTWPNNQYGYSLFDEVVVDNPDALNSITSTGTASSASAAAAAAGGRGLDMLQEQLMDAEDLKPCDLLAALVPHPMMTSPLPQSLPQSLQMPQQVQQMLPPQQVHQGQPQQVSQMLSPQQVHQDQLQQVSQMLSPQQVHQDQLQQVSQMLPPQQVYQGQPQQADQVPQPVSAFAGVGPMVNVMTPTNVSYSMIPGMQPGLPGDQASSSAPAEMTMDRCGPAEHRVMKRQRSVKKPVPEEKKDNKYYEKRTKNNVAAKKSRDCKKAKQLLMMLQTENVSRKLNFLRAMYLTLCQRKNLLENFRQAWDDVCTNPSMPARDIPLMPLPDIYDMLRGQFGEYDAQLSNMEHQALMARATVMAQPINLQVRLAAAAESDHMQRQQNGFFQDAQMMQEQREDEQQRQQKQQRHHHHQQQLPLREMTEEDVKAEARTVRHDTQRQQRQRKKQKQVWIQQQEQQQQEQRQLQQQQHDQQQQQQQQEYQQMQQQLMRERQIYQQRLERKEQSQKRKQQNLRD